MCLVYVIPKQIMTAEHTFLRFKLQINYTKLGMLPSVLFLQIIMPENSHAIFVCKRYNDEAIVKISLKQFLKDT